MRRMFERKPLRITLSLCLSITAFAACSRGDDDDDDVVTPDAAVGTPDVDPGAPDAPAGTPDADLTPDATPPEGLQAARDAADGTVSIAIPNVLVTYKKPALGSDVAGFFVQKVQAGPALFIAVDPTTLAPEPAVGDDVTFTITTMGTDAQLRQAEAITGFAVNSSGNDVAALAQDLSGMSGISGMIGSLESELVTFTAIAVAEAFSSAGAGHEAAQLTTAPADANLRLRLPATLRDTLDLDAACAVTFTAPMWRFNDEAQPSPYDAADFTAIVSCPAPTVVSAVALSSTEVRVTFSRRIDAGSIVAPATQFIIDGGLTVSAAVVSDRDVTLTTSAQTIGFAYTVTVADTVLDTVGTGVPAGSNTATFDGFLILAEVIISELNANIDPNCDLLELRVLGSGSLDGFEVGERDAIVLTFTGLIVTAGDLIVVHFDSADCNETSAANETSAIDEMATATHPRNYDTAWDWYTSDGGLTRTDNVITVYNNAGVILDAVFASDGLTGSAAGGTEAQAAVVAAADEWEMVGGGIPAGGFIDGDFNAHAVQGLTSTGTDLTQSIQRLAGDDTNNVTDWTQGASSWGALNCPIEGPTAGNDLVFENVDTVTGEITIRNKGAGAINIGSGPWQLCASFTYALVTSVSIVSGDLDLASDEAVTVQWDGAISASSDLGLYDSGTFTDSASMQAFTQWGAGGIGRESVAVGASLWTAGDFIDLHGADGFTATGDVTGSAGYTRADAVCLP